MIQMTGHSWEMSVKRSRVLMSCWLLFRDISYCTVLDYTCHFLFTQPIFPQDFDSLKAMCSHPQSSLFALHPVHFKLPHLPLIGYPFLMEVHLLFTNYTIWLQLDTWYNNVSQWFSHRFGRTWHNCDSIHQNVNDRVNNISQLGSQ